MTIRIFTVLCFAASISITMAAQSGPVLVSANIPKHPPLACQARIGGVVKLTFTLGANPDVPTDVEAVSGPALLKDAAVENVKTWRFQNHYAEGTYETTFDYQLPMSGPEKVILNRSAAWKLLRAFRSSGNRDHRKIAINVH